MQHPDDYDNLCRISVLYVQKQKLNKALVSANILLDLCIRTSINADSGLKAYDVALECWRSDRYSSRENLW